MLPSLWLAALARVSRLNAIAHQPLLLLVTTTEKDQIVPIIIEITWNEINLPLAFLSPWFLPPSGISWFDSKSSLTFGDAVGCQNSATEYRWNIINLKRAHVSLTEKTLNLWLNSSCKKGDLTQQCEQLWNMKENSRRYRWLLRQRSGTWLQKAPASVTATSASRFGGYIKHRVPVPGTPWTGSARTPCVWTSPPPPQINAAYSSKGRLSPFPTHLYYLLKEELLTDTEALGFRLKVSYPPAKRKA